MSGCVARLARVRNADEHHYCRRLLETHFARGRIGRPSESEVFAFAREYRKVRRGEALADLREALALARAVRSSTPTEPPQGAQP